MDTKLNQTTSTNPTNNRVINTVQLSNDPPLTEDTLGPSHPVLTTSKNESISDPTSIRNTHLFQHPITFASGIEWNVDQEVNTALYDQPLLTILQQLEASPGGQTLRAHSFFRTGVDVLLELTSSPFHRGKLVFYYIPPGVDTNFRDNIFAKVQYPCTYADSSNATKAKLHIPFVAIKDFFSTNNPDGNSDFGTIGVSVFNKLAIGTGGQTAVNFALTLLPTINQVAVPVLAHNITLQSFLAPIAEIVGTAALNDLGSLAATAASSAAGIGLEHGLEKMLGLDVKKVKIVDSLNEQLNDVNKNNTSSTKDLNISAPSLSNMVGLGTEHLSLFPENTYYKYSSSFNPVDDDMNLQNIAQVPSLLRTVEWTNDATPGTILFMSPINPMLVASTGPTGNVHTTYPTYLAHVTQPFAYWKGSIDFHITVASTEQHKGQLIAAWIPFDSYVDDTSVILGETPTIQQLSLFPCIKFDLALNTEFSFSIPYNSETPFRNVTPNNVLVQPNSVDNSLQDESLGVFVIMIFNRLTNPTSVANSVAMNVYIKGGSDYAIRTLRNHNDKNNYETIRYITLQAGNVAMESTRGGMLHMPMNRVGRVDTHISDTSFLDDDSEHNLQKLLSKYYPQIGFEFTLDANSVRSVQLSNLPGLTARAPRDNARSDPKSKNLINHFRDIYAFWSGSLNYFIIHDSTVNTPVLLMATHDPTFNVTNNQLVPSESTDRNNTYALIDTDVQLTNNVDYSDTALYSHISNLRVNPTVEITPAYRSIFRRLYTTSNVLGANDDPDETAAAGVVLLRYSNSTATDIPVAALVFQSVGSDFKFKYLIPPPSLNVYG